MSDYARGNLDLDDEDRLPWLEPADREDDSEGVSPLKLLAFIVTGLIALGAIVWGVYWLQNRPMPGLPGGDVQVIAAPPGDYKVAASEADAKKFAGEGDAAFAASEGVDRDGRIDASRVPEAPVTAGAAPVSVDASRVSTASKPSSQFSAPVADATRGAASNATPAKGAKSSGAMIQLGAYGSQSSAKDAWGRLSKRFDYLATLGTSVETVQVGSTTLYRLRAAAGTASQAGAICGRLRVAGESCLVVN
ncbi:MAG: SPOR domain-containing protein [Sphingobium sp.]